MKILAEINEKDLNISKKCGNSPLYKLRQAARAVLFDFNDRISLLFNTQNNHHKLPGGGIEEGESVEDALKREVLEETGCEFEKTGEVGEIVEYKDKQKEHQISYCYLARVTKKVGQPKFTGKEKEQGFVLKWISVDQAIKLIRNDKPKSYTGRFIQKRDLIFLEAVKKYDNKKS